MDRGTVENLSGTELEFAFASAMNYALMGSSEGPFVLQHEDARTLMVFGSRKKLVKFSSFNTDCSDVPLEVAEKLGASLSMKNGVPTCQIGDTEIGGKNYLESLMRAIVLHKSAK